MAPVCDEDEQGLEAAKLRPTLSHDEKGRRRSQTPTRQPAVSPHVLLLATVDGGSLAPACSSRRSLPAARAFFALRSPSPARDCSVLSSPSPAGGLGQRPLLARHEFIVAGGSPGC
jgi:hypothetical protein